MKKKVKNILLTTLFLLFSVAPNVLYAQSTQTVNVYAPSLLAHSEISFAPRTGSFVEGSSFQVPILLNTKGNSINGIEVRVNFDKNKLAIVNPTGGVSIIGIWTEPPKFDNTKGTASYVGVVPDGITTQSGLVSTITFKAIATGDATVSVSTTSRILLNDGLGTATQVDFGRANYNILTKAPEGVQIFSETHPSQSTWYNNNNPIISWTKDPGVKDFSYTIDDKPNTIPDDIADTDGTTKNFSKLGDGLWYFHIKGEKNGVWGTTGHFLLRIDTTPPAAFTPEVNYLVAAVIYTERTLVSFFTTDNLSGVDHYEVGIIDKNQPATESPVFEEAESPFQVPLNPNGKLQVIVRAVDKAGNVRDESVDARVPLAITKFIKDYLIYILLGIILLVFILSIIHYLVGHHIIRAIRRFRKIINNENKEPIIIPLPIEEKKEPIVIATVPEIKKEQTEPEPFVIPDFVIKDKDSVIPTPIEEKQNDSNNLKNWIDHIK